MTQMALSVAGVPNFTHAILPQGEAEGVGVAVAGLTLEGSLMPEGRLAAFTCREVFPLLVGAAVTNMSAETEIRMNESEL
jgi:hypothetical protein